MAASQRSVDPKACIHRNGTIVMNWAHFCSAPDNLDKQAQALEIMEEIYSVPFESQSVVADLLVKEHEDLAPYMFYEAVRTGHAEVTKALKESGMVGFSYGPDRYDDAVYDCKKRQAEEIFALSEEESAEGVRKWLEDFPGDHKELLYQAAVAGARDTIVRLLELQAPSISETDLSSWLVPLHAACYNGHLECAKVLVAHGYDVNCLDEHGGTPLMRAAVGGNTEIVRWLLENGADAKIRETREGNWNALEYGGGRGLEIVGLLLDPCGWSPAALMAAASFGDRDSFELIAKAAGFPEPAESLRLQTFWEETATAQHKEAILGSLEKGGSGGETAILRYLLAMLPQTVRKEEAVREALKQMASRAALGNYTQVVILFLGFCRANDIGPDALQQQVNDLLLDSARNNSPDVAKLLLEKYSADVNYRVQPAQINALYNAVVNDHAEMIEILVKQFGADIHQASGKFANGPTPMWLAVDRQYEKSARMLLACGGPVESVGTSILDRKTTKVFISADKACRAPVRLRSEMDPAWDEELSTERFLCLEYPDGWPGKVQQRKSDAELKDDRDLRLPEDSGFVVV